MANFKLTDPYGSAPTEAPFTQSVSSAKPWGKGYAAADFTLGQLLDRAVERYGDEDALVFPELNYRKTWTELAAEVEFLARGMMGLGIRYGEHVAILSTNQPDFVLIMLAAAKIGAILMPFNTNYQEFEFGQALNHGKAKTVFSIENYRDADFLRMAAIHVPELKTCDRGHLRSRDLPYLKRIVALSDTARKGMYTINEVRAQASKISTKKYMERLARVKTHDTALIQYTSGTSGFPKGAMLSHYNIVNDAYWIGACMDYTHKDRICVPVPLFHCFGSILAVVTAAVFGATMVMLSKYDPVAVMMAIEKEKCTALYGVPTMYIGILDHPLFSKFDFSSIRTGVMSGAPCPVIRMEQTIEKMGMKDICVPYGLTEAGPVMTMTRNWDKSIEHRCHTIGQALPGIEVAIIDPNTGDLAPLGAEGEICCRGYNVMSGYYNMPHETAAAIDKNGWLHSGDVGRMDAEGYFYFMGRIKDIIIRGGENISAAEVENFISRMPEIAQVAVVGVPSRKYGEQPSVFVKLKPGCTLSLLDVQDFCDGKIAWFKIPKYMKIVDEFPLTGSGKVQKYKLRDEAAHLWPEA